jgi:hypothetical protein
MTGEELSQKYAWRPAASQAAMHMAIVMKEYEPLDM